MRPIRPLLPFASMFLLAGGLMTVVQAPCLASSPTIVRVEEDWELVVAIPDANSTAPQVTTLLSPSGSGSNFVGAFELNHRSQPDFQPGGLQVQLWDTDIVVASQTGSHEGVMSTSSDTVEWTQSLTLFEGQLFFEVTDGTSSTWGTFGAPGELQVSTATSLSNLNSYSPVFLDQ